MTGSLQLTDAEIRATLYFAVGVTSESGNKAYQLAVAGDRVSTPRVEPADDNGYSIGTIQTDLGQHYQPGNPLGENVGKMTCKDVARAIKQYKLNGEKPKQLGV